MLELGQEWLLFTSPFRLKETTEPTDPEIPSDVLAFYAKDKAGVSALYYKDDAFVEHDLSGGLTGTGVANRLAFWTGATTLDDVPRTLTPGSVLFAGSDFLPQEDNSGLFYDDTNNDLIVGHTANPFSSLVGRGLAVVRNSGFAEATVGEFGAGTMTTALRLMKAGGTASAPTATQSGMGGVVGLLGYGATAFSGARAIVRFVAGENWTDAAQGTYITLETTQLLGATLTERFRVGPSGEWGIGGATYGTSGNLFQSGGSGAAPSWLDHTTDFLSQYALLAGRSGTNDFTGDVGVTGNLKLPATTTTVGQITVGGTRFAHSLGSSNTFVGVGAGNLSLTSGLQNAGFGTSVLAALTSGNFNVAFGESALSKLITGSGNLAFGRRASFNQTAGDGNIAIGLNAMNNNLITGSTLAIGNSALAAFVSGIGNTAIGINASLSNVTGAANTSVGNGALQLVTGANHTAVGYQAGNGATTGNNCTFLGRDADVSVATISNAMALGHSATVGQSNYAMIGANGVCVGIDGAARPTTGSGGLIFPDGTALATMASNTAGMYADDIAGNVSMHVINENGDIIKLIKTGTYTPTNVGADRSYDADSTTVDELADVLGTLIADLQLTGFLG